MDKFEKIRENYPALKTYTYFDSSSIGLISTKNYDKIINHLNHRYNNGMDGAGYLKNWDYTNSLRKPVAKMINADASEIFFGENSSSIMNVLTSGLNFNEGSNIITSNLSFPSVPYSWMNQSKKGLETRFVKAKNGMISFESIKELVDDKTVAISLCLVEHSSGFKHDLSKIGKLCREKGIILAVDTTQCLGVLEIDVKKMNIDFLASSTYKWLTNLFGLGIGYISNELQKKINQIYAGWASTVNRTDYNNYELKFLNSAQKYEMGGLNWIALKSLDASVQTYLELGKKDIEKQVFNTVNYLFEKISQTPYIEATYRFPDNNMSHIIFINFPEYWKLNNDILCKNKIRANVSSKNSIRIGIHFFNNKNDTDKLFEFFEKHNRKCKNNSYKN